MKFEDTLTSLKNNSLIRLDSREIEGGVDDDRLLQIANCLKINTSLTHLLLQGESITNTGIAPLCESLSIHPSIKYFHLTNTHLDVNSIKSIVDMLKANESIMELNLADNNINDEVVSILADGLKILGNTTGFVKTLHLNGNQISDAGTAALAEIFKLNECLCALNLANNNITDHGALVFAKLLTVPMDVTSKYISEIPSLTELNLANNFISEEGAQQFVIALQNNDILTELNLANSQMSSNDTLLKIKNRLAKNKILRNQFRDLDKDFNKVKMLNTGENQSGIYINKNDGTKWLIKTNASYGLGSRLGVITEVYAGQLMKLCGVPYPEVILINDGGGFKVGYQFIENLKKESNPKKPILNIVENFIACFWFGDSDCARNGYFQESEQHVHFYKLDLGDAFLFDNKNLQIKIDNLTPQAILNFLWLKNLDTSRISVENVISCIERIANLEMEEILLIGQPYREMLGKAGEEFLEKLFNRKDMLKNLIPVLKWKLKDSESFDNIMHANLPKYHFNFNIPPLKPTRSTSYQDQESSDQKSFLSTVNF